MRKIGVISIASLIIAVLSIWAFAYQSADRFLDISLAEAAVVTDSRLGFEAELGVPFVRLDSVDVYVDGVLVPADISMGKRGFNYSLFDTVEDGSYHVELAMTFDMLLDREIRIERNVLLDTVPPQVSFSGFDGVITATEPGYMELAGQTEPEATITLSMNGEPLTAPLVDDKGTFNLALTMPSEASLLQVGAEDLAGNAESFEWLLVIDKQGPVIREQIPAGGETLASDEPRFQLTVADIDSQLASATVELDGVTLLPAYSEGKQSAVFVSEILTDGRHEVHVHAVDTVGNEFADNWKFRSTSSRLQIDLAGRVLTHFKKGKEVKKYKIAIGMEAYPTPTGTWKVISKRKNPPWRNPKSEWSMDMPDVIPPGPGNPLGTRALYLNSPGIRIHGTYQSLSVGQAVSHGCIRMTIGDSEELYDLVAVGTPVLIR